MPVTLPTGTIASEAGLDRVEELLIAERLREELYGTALHCLHGHRDVGMRRDEDDRHLPVRRGKVALKLETASAWHSNVEHQATRAVARSHLQKFGNRRKLAAVEADRPQKTPYQVTRNSGSSSMIRTLGFASRVPGACIRERLLATGMARILLTMRRPEQPRLAKRKSERLSHRLGPPALLCPECSPNLLNCMQARSTGAPA